MDPRDAEAWAAIGWQHVRMDHADEAAIAVAEAMRIAPNDTGALGLQAHIFASSGDMEAAALAYDQAAALCNFPHDEHIYRAWASVARGDSEQAAIEFTELCRLRPDIPGYRTDLGTIQYNLGRLDDAIATMQAAIKAVPTDWRAYYVLGVAFLYRDDYDTAAHAEKKLRRLHPVRAARLRKTLIPWERRRLYGTGFSVLLGWTMFGGLTSMGVPLIAFPAYQAAGGGLFALYVALTIRLNRIENLPDPRQDELKSEWDSWCDV